MSTPDTLPSTSRTPEPVTASEVTVGQVRKLAQLITQELSDKSGHPLFSLLGPNHESIPLPTDVLALMQQVLAILASGDAVTVVPVHKELTTQQAANLLNVSRQYLVQLLDEGRIPFHRTGTHRRVYSKDVLEYRARQKSERRAQLDAMMRESQDAGGYPELD
ncbi:helix-turn-helix domain-containing protein [Corallococcus sp. AB049A]|uniref:Helix-turn-helix domain-containing protein n=1 Tax=Corallococcus interemptor TaxID=2316720 RepID=A0A3A8Q5W8_9BACT|nr:helix-turn-helix domain-containing protein [Corallococcus sp. AB050B]RKH64079.1 helix-turn-helix domain-containing protein [Corallococcus interemptor]RKI73413.1 helix-turn-helix domain-containing protein [Corallococcus sp. AB049A]